MCARSGAAGDLEVNKSVTIFEFIFLEEAQGYGFKLACIKATDTEFLEAESKAIEMVETFEEAALVGADDFVNAIGKKKTAVVGGNGDLGFIQVLAVIVSDHLSGFTLAHFRRERSDRMGQCSLDWSHRWYLSRQSLGA